MTNTATIEQFSQMVLKKSSEAEKGAGLWWVLMFSWDVITLKRYSKSSIDLSRRLMEECATLCADASCMVKRYEHAALIRDKLLLINDKMARAAFPGFVRRDFEEMLDAWDDLAEDCAISSDPETRELISAIAAKL